MDNQLITQLTSDKPKTMKYDAFISYSHSDGGNIAPAIQEAIENIGKPWYKLGRNLTLFRDETNLAASPQLWTSIENALSESKYLILLSSPKAAESYWINRELENWCTNNFTKEKGLENIFVAVTSGEVLWNYETNDFDIEKTNCIPKTLYGKFKEEPLFIDLRDYVSNDLKKIEYKSPAFVTANTKIIGAILGKAPREIESEEAKRNRSIKRVILLAFLILIALLIFSLIQRRNAIEQKNIANNETKNAKLSEERAIINLRKYKTEEFERNFRNGNIYLEANEYSLAKSSFLSADRTAKDLTFNKNINSSKIKYLDSVIAVCDKNNLK